MRSPVTNKWDRENSCIHFWDGRTVQGDLQVSGNAWTFRPSRPLSSGADLLIALPLRRLQFSRISAPGQSGAAWQIEVAGGAAHPGGALAMTDWYIDVMVDPAGAYKVHNLGDIADAAHQRFLNEEQLLQALRALDAVFEGLHRSNFSVPSLLQLWDVRIPT